MQDDTRDALLIAVAEWAVSNTVEECDRAESTLKTLLAKAKHEQDRPNDRGA